MTRRAIPPRRQCRVLCQPRTAHGTCPYRTVNGCFASRVHETVHSPRTPVRIASRRLARSFGSQSPELVGVDMARVLFWRVEAGGCAPLIHCPRPCQPGKEPEPCPAGGPQTAHVAASKRWGIYGRGQRPFSVATVGPGDIARCGGQGRGRIADLPDFSQSLEVMGLAPDLPTHARRSRHDRRPMGKPSNLEKVPHRQRRLPC